MRMMRCKAELTIGITATGRRVELWPGIDVDFDRELAPGFTMAQAVVGFESYFDPTPADVPAKASTKAVKE